MTVLAIALFFVAIGLAILAYKFDKEELYLWCFVPLFVAGAMLSGIGGALEKKDKEPQAPSAVERVEEVKDETPKVQKEKTSARKGFADIGILAGLSVIPLAVLTPELDIFYKTMTVLAIALFFVAIGLAILAYKFDKEELYLWCFVPLFVAGAMLSGIGGALEKKDKEPQAPSAVERVEEVKDETPKVQKEKTSARKGFADIGILAGLSVIPLAVLTPELDIFYKTMTVLAIALFFVAIGLAILAYKFDKEELYLWCFVPLFVAGAMLSGIGGALEKKDKEPQAPSAVERVEEVKERLQKFKKKKHLQEKGSQI